MALHLPRRRHRNDRGGPASDRDVIRPAIVPVVGRLARLAWERVDPRPDRQFARTCNRELTLQASWDELRMWREQAA